jgi:hypothetical protein
MIPATVIPDKASPFRDLKRFEALAFFKIPDSRELFPG